ncbi:hypothetical protein BC831DRAFT_483675 [Entophlyctis helioformis]|nr:hypothetical protein BC831DRAFT_483675 [Entophlyctis helioformis]
MPSPALPAPPAPPADPLPLQPLPLQQLQQEQQQQPLQQEPQPPTAAISPAAPATAPAPAAPPTDASSPSQPLPAMPLQPPLSALSAPFVAPAPSPSGLPPSSSASSAGSASLSSTASTDLNASGRSHLHHHGSIASSIVGSLDSHHAAGPSAAADPPVQAHPHAHFAQEYTLPSATAMSQLQEQGQEHQQQDGLPRRRKTVNSLSPAASHPSDARRSSTFPKADSRSRSKTAALAQDSARADSSATLDASRPSTAMSPPAPDALSLIMEAAIKSKPRNKEFHKIFSPPLIADYETCIDSFICAWQKDILRQGKLYATLEHFCFTSNILGITATAIIKVSKIRSIVKANAAFVIPNAILITTLDGTEYFFASFNARDSVLRILTTIWQKHREQFELRREGSSVSTASTVITTTESKDSQDDCDRLLDHDLVDSPDKSFPDNELGSYTLRPGALRSAALADHARRGEHQLSGVDNGMLVMLLVAICFFVSIGMLVVSVQMLWKVQGVVGRMDRSLGDYANMATVIAKSAGKSI